MLRAYLTSAISGSFICAYQWYGDQGNRWVRYSLVRHAAEVVRFSSSL